MQYSTKKGNMAIVVIVISAVLILGILGLVLINKARNGAMMGAKKTAPSHVSDSYSRTSMWDTGYFWDDLEVKDDFWVDGDFLLAGNANVGGFTYGLTTLASSTATAYATTTISYFTNYSGLDMTPGNLAVSLYLPATSTMTSFITNAGECYDWRFRNLDGTAATSTTIVAGTGIDLVENENGDVVIEGGNGALLKFCRELDTDVTVYVDEYINAD